MQLSAIESSAREREFQHQLRDMALAVIEREQLTREDLAQRLDMLPVGVEMLLGRKTWPMHVCLYVTEVLDVDVRLVSAAK